MLEAINLSYSVGRRAIVQTCSLQIRPGEFTAVVGPNGAGKTSLLKILTNEITSYTGTVSLNRMNISSIGNERLSCQRAVLPQHSTMNFPFTVEQVIQIGRYPHRASTAKDQLVVNEVIERTGLHTLRGRIYNTLSGGEQQRVQLARVMAQLHGGAPGPKYLLLDEPTSSLDLAQQHAVLEMAKAMCLEKVGVLAILHDLNLAAQYADHVLFLKDGKTVAQGPLMEAMTKINIEETFSYPVNVSYDEWTSRPVIYAVSRQQQSLMNSNLTLYHYEHHLR